MLQINMSEKTKVNIRLNIFPPKAFADLCHNTVAPPRNPNSLAFVEMFITDLLIILRIDGWQKFSPDFLY